MKQIIYLSKRQSRIILILSFFSILLITITAVAGIFIPGTYYKETANWALQSMGQDLVDLFLIVPLLITASILAFRKSRTGFIIWGGINLYVVYTYVIYSFDIHFNRLFLAYCMVLGLSFYSFIYFIYLSIRNQITYLPDNKAAVRVSAGYFLIISYIFFFLWLSKIVPAVVLHVVPAELTDAGLVTNPVHVLDLAVFLPGLFITSLLLSAKNPLGYLIAPVMLVFSVLMSLTIACLICVMRSQGIETGYTVIVVMGVLTVMGTVLFTEYFKASALKTKKTSAKAL